MRLLGRHFSRAEASRLVGDLTQLGSITPLEFTDGPARGTRVYSVRSAGGMDFEVHADRGLDIGFASVESIPLSWHSMRGTIHGAYAEHSGAGWLRTFGGGLLTSCGLSSIGLASTDRSEDFGLHGRVSSLPAQDIGIRRFWEGDDLILEIEGRVIETSLAGPSLELARTIRTKVGVPEIEIRDTITSIGLVPAPMMFRHHINLGFPYVQPGDRIETSAHDVLSRDGIEVPESWATLQEPNADSPEEVYVLDSSRADRAWARLLRGDRVLVDISWSADTMPRLIVWKQLQPRFNGFAIEPSSNDDSGRAAARAAGDLIELAPGEQKSFATQIAVAKSSAQVKGLSDAGPSEKGN